MTDYISTRLFPEILNMSLTGSIVILAVLVIRFFLRKAPKKWSYLLWLVVAFRLACPVSLPSPVSLLGAVHAPVTDKGTIEYIPQTIVRPQTPAVSPAVPAPDSITPAPQLPVTPSPISVTDILPVIWLIGMAVVLIYSVVSYLRLRRRLSNAILYHGNVWQSDRVQSPFILGFLRPRIYIPFGLDNQTLSYVLAHEHCHLKRKDHIIKPLAFLLLTLHWFNPLCWLAFHLMGRDMEMSCDEQVLAREDGDRKVYSTALLSFAANRRFPAPSPLAFGEGEVRPRITNALNWKQPKVWVTAAAGVLCVAALLLCALNPKTGTDISGTYADIQTFIDETLAAEKTAYFFVSGGGANADGSAVTAAAEVTGTKVHTLIKTGTLSGLSPDGVLEAWEFSYLLSLDADPEVVTAGLAGGQYEQDGWYNLDGYFNIIALRYEDGSYDILGYEHQGGDNMDFLGERSYEEALHDWYVKSYGLTDTHPPYVIDWPQGEGMSFARRYDSNTNRWSIYIPIYTWYSSGTDSWSSAYGTGATLTVSNSTLSLDELLQTARAEGRTVTDEGSCYRIDYERSSIFLYPHPAGASAWSVYVQWPAAPSPSPYAPSPEQEREELFRMARSFALRDRGLSSP